MKQRVRGVSVLTTNSHSLIFGVCLLAIVPVFCSLVWAPGASALSLPGVINDITAPVLEILAKKSAPTQQPVAPAHSNSTQIAPPVSNGNSSASGAAGSDPEPIVYGAPLETMPPLSQSVQQITAPSYSRSEPVLARSASAARSSSFALLQPSEQGWRIAGIAWYWWGLIVVMAGGVWWGVMQLRRRTQTALVE